MSATRVLLLRHGRTAYNAEARFQGQTDIALDEIGLGQAKRVADTLATELADGPVKIFSSDLSRAAQTAEPVAARLASRSPLTRACGRSMPGSGKACCASRSSPAGLSSTSFGAWVIHRSLD